MPVVSRFNKTELLDAAFSTETRQKIYITYYTEMHACHVYACKSTVTAYKQLCYTDKLQTYDYYDYFQESTQDSFIYPVILFNINLSVACYIAHIL